MSWRAMSSSASRVTSPSCSRASRATRSGSPARAGTTCRRRSSCFGTPTSRSRCSSRTIAEARTAGTGVEMAVAVPKPGTLTAMTESVADADQTGRALTRHENVNLPNTLTTLRLLLIPAILLTFDAQFTYHQLAAPALFIVASIPDSMDGRIARRFGKVTTLGKFLDPLADKMLILAVLAFLVPYALLPAWLVPLLLAR